MYVSTCQSSLLSLTDDFGQIPQNDDVSAYPWEYSLDDLNMPGMAQGLSLPQPQSFAQNQINHYPQHDHVPQIYVDTSLPNNHPYPSTMTPSSAYMSPMTPSYGDSSSTTDESGKFAYSPNTPFLSPNERYTHIASGTQSQTSSPTIRSQVEYSIKSEVSHLIDDVRCVVLLCIRFRPRTDPPPISCHPSWARVPHLVGVPSLLLVLVEQSSSTPLPAVPLYPRRDTSPTL